MKWIVVTSALVLAGCSGPLSALDPAGRGAQRIAELFWGMSLGALIIWMAVVSLTIYAIVVRPGAHRPSVGAWFILGGGAIFPTIVLAGLLTYGLALMPELLQPAPEGSMTIAVSGEQWWWRIRYRTPNGTVDLANEIRLPVGEPVTFHLESPDVIHALWIPVLGGKMDMIPGRTNRLTLEPIRTGVFRGVCAEYCGTSHALMRFDVVVMEKADFDAWLTHQQAVAQPPLQPLVRHGQELFLANGCGACHTVRGTPADGVVGPDLTHVGSRLSLGAGILPNDPESFLTWMARTAQVKPGVHMPAFGMLPQEDLKALATYLDALQ